MNKKMITHTTVLLAVAATAIIPILLFSQTANAIIAILIGDFVPIATSGDNVYVVWSSNKTGNNEVMFKASTDAGKTFSDKMNLACFNTSRHTLFSWSSYSSYLS